MITLFAALSLAAALSQPSAERVWQDPAVFEVNREPMRSTFVVYPASQKPCPGAEFERSALYQSIGGTWAFHWTENSYDPQPEGFQLPSCDDSSWGSMPVPGIWEMNGYGDPLYVNSSYAWHRFFANNPPYVPERQNHVGIYRKNISVPEQWEGKRIYVHIGAACSNLALWINGEEAGYSQDSKLEAEFDITPYVNLGQDNLFVMRIHRWCDGTYLECQDFWRLCGISRDCYIYARERECIQDVKLVAGLSDDYRDGLLKLNLKADKGISSAKITLCDASGRTVARRTVAISEGSADVEVKVPAVKQWSAEVPYLYTLTVSDGKESAAFNVGFRRVEIKGSELLVNGKRVLIKGVNRHEMSPTSAYYVPRELMLKDVELLKSMNVNAVRTCHYPNDPYMYDLFDRYGFYVMDEANVESHGMGYGELTLAKNPLYEAAHMDRNQRMVLRDFNHPSVICWSLGNESGNGPNFHRCYDWIKSYDSSRPVHYEQANYLRYGRKESNYNSDIDSPMYPSIKSCEEYLAQDPGRPFIMCEYAHAMGNSMGGFKEYWDLIRSNPYFQGGFIWDFVDQALEWKDPESGRVEYRYGGCYNPWDATDNSFNCNGFVSATRVPHSDAWEVKYQYQDIWASQGESVGEVDIYNEFFFKSLAGYTMKWEVLCDGVGALKGEVKKLSAGPQKAECLKLFKASDIAGLDSELFLNLRFFLGDSEVAHNQILLKERNVVQATALQGAASQGEVSQGEASYATAPVGGGIEIDGWTVRGDSFEIAFGPDAFIYSYIKDGVQYLGSPLKFNFLRATTENDNGTRDNRAYEHYRSCYTWRFVETKLKLMTIERHGENVLAKAQYHLATVNAKVYMTYLIRPDGSMVVTEEMQARPIRTQYMPYMHRYGIALDMPDSFDTIEFYGAGPHETYCDRKSSGMVGIYRQSVDEQYCMSYVRPQESGTHVDLRWWKVMGKDGRGLEFRSDNLFSASAIAFPFSQIDMLSPDYRKYPSLLEKDGLTHVNVDLLQLGVGGEDSWGALPLEQYRVHYQDRTFTFEIKPL